MYKILFIISSLLCLNFSFAAERPLIVATNAEFPPFCYIEDSTIVGFDIDIAKAVAKKMGRSIELKDVPFDALIPDVMLGRVDFVAAGLSYTEERAKRVFFTKPYLSGDPLVILTTAKQNLTLDELKSKNVVVIEGFTADCYMTTQGMNNLIRLPAQSDGFIALKTGRADAFVTAKTTADVFFEKQNISQYNLTVLEGTGDTCALVVSKTKPEMLVSIQKALDEMEKDGTMAEIKQKWKLK